MKGECPSPRPDCKYADGGGCFSDTHHLFYPRRDYRTRVEREFRELPVNKEQICRSEHDERHAVEPVPQKPTKQEMLGAIALELSQE
jgi:hypothetical protein